MSLKKRVKQLEERIEFLETQSEYSYNEVLVLSIKMEDYIFCQKFLQNHDNNFTVEFRVPRHELTYCVVLDCYEDRFVYAFNGVVKLTVIGNSLGNTTEVKVIDCGSTYAVGVFDKDKKECVKVISIEKATAKKTILDIPVDFKNSVNFISLEGA